jgi:hypothetical protein
MHKALKISASLLALLLVAHKLSARTVAAEANEVRNGSLTTRSVQCDAALDSGEARIFREHSRDLVAAAYLSDLRVELGLQPWPADSVQRVEEPALCARIDSLITAWRSGPGAGQLVGQSGSVGPVAVMRIGPTVFHVHPGPSVPMQPGRSLPFFVVDTAAPARVAFWKSTS